MEWQLTGRRIIQVLTGRNAGIATDVRTMMKGPTTDPTSPTSECLSYLEELCTKVERSVAGMQHDLPAAPKAVYKAFMGRLTLIESKMLDQDGLRDRIEETKGRIERSKAEKKRDRKQLTALSANNIAQSDLSECQVVGCDNAGRAMPGRRWSDGLHQAVESKESVRIEEETQTYATITIQNYFRLYTKLAGMTGTAATEAQEFFDIFL